MLNYKQPIPPPTQLLQNHHICSLNLPHPSSLQVFAIAIAKSLHHRANSFSCYRSAKLQGLKMVKTDYRDLCGVPHHMMSYTDLHLRQAILLIHRRMVIFSLFTALFSFYSESIYLPCQKDREKGGGFPLFSHKKGERIRSYQNKGWRLQLYL